MRFRQVLRVLVSQACEEKDAAFGLDSLEEMKPEEWFSVCRRRFNEDTALGLQ